MKKRILALILSLTMAVSLLPISVLANADGQSADYDAESSVTDPADEVSDADEAVNDIVTYADGVSAQFEFHYTCSSGGWAGFGTNLIDENGDTISATVSGDYTITSGRYTTTVDMPYTFSVEDFAEAFIPTAGICSFLYATVTDPNYGDTEHTFDEWENEEKVGANELYGSEENPVVSVTIDGTAAAENPNYETQDVRSKTWHFTLTYADDTSVTIPIYGNADGANDNGGKYCPKYLELNLYFEAGHEAVLNLGNGNGTYSDGDYTGSSSSGGDALRYGTGNLKNYADADGKVTINLPSDSDLAEENDETKSFTVVGAVGEEGEDGYLPAVTVELGKEQAYNYKLVGWINIATGKYYDVSNGSATATIDLSDDNVFYADWIGADYDRGSRNDKDLRDDVVSTAGFVTFRLFDYNELFNLYSAELTQNGTAGESWTDSRNLYEEPLLSKDANTPSPIGNSFIFQNNGTTYANSYVLSHANPARWNLWTSNSVWSNYDEYGFVLDAEKYWNIKSPDSTILGMLYDTDEKSLGVHYVGEGDYLFWIDENGYYTYNSAESGAAYNQSDKRFYVYEDYANSFFPYNGHTEEIKSSNGLIDYWFGMYMQVDFYLPGSTAAGTEENPVNQVDTGDVDTDGNPVMQDMTFDFSGDDDIMIFVDNKLVVDMSGIHSTSYARINFSTNTVTYSMGRDASGAPYTNENSSVKHSERNDLNLSAGNHTMKVYYMERGASASNLEIQFNVTPAWEYETGPLQAVYAKKQWHTEDGEPIDGEETEEMPAVNLGLFQKMEEGTDYTVDGSAYTIVSSHPYDGNDIQNHTYRIGDDGYCRDDYGQINAWLTEEGDFYVRVSIHEMQYIKDGTYIDPDTGERVNSYGWYYTWELLEPDGEYLVLELSDGTYFKATTETEQQEHGFYFWTIIGENEIEEMILNAGEYNEQTGETTVASGKTAGYIVLTNAAQNKIDGKYDKANNSGYVIVLDEDGELQTEGNVTFSQGAELSKIENEATGTSIYSGVYGAVGGNTIADLSGNAVWCVETTGDTTSDTNGEGLDLFRLYIEASGTDGGEPVKYYLTETTDADETRSLAVTKEMDKAAEFYDDAMGELRIHMDGEDTDLRVTIENGEIKIAEVKLAEDDGSNVKIYSWNNGVGSGDIFTVTNTLIDTTVDISGSKTWDDADNQDGKRPSYILVTLYADGEPVKEHGQNVMAVSYEGNNWSWSFTDLPRYDEDGNEITYTVKENAVDAYEETYGEKEVDANGDITLNITNTHTPETVDIEGEKTWDDNNNQDGARPESITVRLCGNGAIVETKTVTQDDGWSWNFTDLPKYENGVEIVYTVTEDAVEDYTTEINGYDITNTHAPGKTSLNVQKIWDDAGDQDGMRPSEITVTLLADGVETEQTLTLDESNNWSGSFTDLDMYENGGTEIEYTVAELEIDDYVSVITGDATVGYVITNTHEPETVTIEGTKIWSDHEDAAGERPESITVYLLADGEIVDKREVKADENWSWSFTNLPKYKSGVEITYTISEDPVENYTPTIGSLTKDAEDDDYTVTITNTHNSGNTSVLVVKQWEDDGNRDGKRPDPEEVTVTLYAGEGENKARVTDENGEARTVTLSDENNWTDTFTNLPIYDENDQKITYSVAEEDVPDGYECHIVSVGESGYAFVLLNLYEPEETEITVHKFWNDGNDLAGIRPESVTITVTGSYSYEDENGKKQTVETGTYTQIITADDDWTAEFYELPVYAAVGNKITYTVSEIEVAGYESSLDCSSTADENVQQNDDGSYTFDITNTHVTDTVDVEGSKTWDDAYDQDGIRPDYITIHLYAGGAEIASTHIIEEEDWSWSFTDLPKYENGEEITYTIVEDAVDGYVSTVDGYDITNSHIPETINIEGEKTWDDNNNQDGIRPESITIHLFADGVEIDSVTVPTPEPTGLFARITSFFTNLFRADNEDGWTWSFTDLPKYSNGEEITYTIVEDAVDGYVSTVDGYDITNTHTPETVDVEGTKTWDDNDNQDGMRPESITVSLLADGEVIDSATVTAADDWSYSFSDLPKYNNGVEIEYTVTETAVDGYETTYSEEGYDITNTHTPETVDVKGSKTWDDNDNQDGTRPESITVRLWNGNTMVDSVEVTKDDDWNWSFTDLPKYADGTEIVYNITEDIVPDYSTTYSEEGYNVTNTHTPEQTSVTVMKAWEDAGDQDGLRPNEIIVALLADGEETGETLTLDESNNWSGSFTDLDMYENGGTEIEYTVAELAIDDYVSVITGDATVGYVITNTHIPETVEVEGSKTWDDKNNQDGMRPYYITIHLFANDEEIASTHITEEEDWSWSFTDLPKYENGVEIVYTVAETAVEGYETTVDGYNVTNTHEPETIDIEGSKTWDDGNNQDGIRPDYITIHLFADGVEIDSVTVPTPEPTGLFARITSFFTNLFRADNEDGWTWSFTDLPKYSNGEEITYTIVEDAVDGYVSTVDGYDITNTHTPETVDVEGTKTWDDANNQDGKRPDSIEITLCADGEVIDSAP